MENKLSSIKPPETTCGAKQLPTNYIRQPYPISAIQADLSNLQIRILVSMMKNIQDGVRRMFERGPVGGQLELFPEMKEDGISIEFKFSDVVDRPYQYRDVERVAHEFMDMVFRYDDKQKGEVTLSHFVNEVTYPSLNNKRDKIRFNFTRKQAQVVFNFTMYSRYLLPVVMSSKSKHTARLYMLVTSARGFEQNNSGAYHWFIGYEELRRILGCDAKDDRGRWCRKSQKQYKHFKSDVLRTAERELKSLADAGKSDCWFEFSEIPEKYDKEPKRLDFLVHLTDIEKSGATEDKLIPELIKPMRKW